MIAIIGAGISGLSLAWHLQKKGIDYMLLEANSLPGGYIKSLEKNGCYLELGPNSLLADQEITEFIQEAGLSAELVPANEVSKDRFILKNGRYQQLPSSPPSLLFNNFFSWKTKWKVLTEPFQPPIKTESETLAAFFTRRFGQEIVDYALTPFVSGIYAGDPKELLLEETFPFLKEYEMKYGSVLKGFIKNKPVRKQSYTFRKGMQTLPIELGKQLKNLYLGHKVISISKNNENFHLKVNSPDGVKDLISNQLVITGPAFDLDFIKELLPEFVTLASQIDYPPIVAIHSVYNKKDVHHHLNGFGSLNPAIENSYSSGHIWNSSVFKGRCSEDQVLFTTFVGGSLNRNKTKLTEEEIKKEVHKELKVHFKISSEPLFQHYTYSGKSIPQYTSTIKNVKKQTEALESQKIYICSNWINGVSISDCIKKGKKLAQKLG